MRLTTQQDLELAVAGICPLCRGSFTLQLQPSEHDTAADLTFAGACERCSVPFSADPAMIVARHPAVVSFYYRHGIDVRDRHSVEFAADVRERTLVSTTPPRLRLRLGVADETLSVTLDGEGAVVAVDGPTAVAD